MHGRTETVKWLLMEGGAKVTEADTTNGNTALLFAALCSHLPTVQFLLKEGGAAISETSYNGYSALHCALDGGAAQTAQWLLEHTGVPIGAVTHADETVWDLLEDHLLTTEFDYPGQNAMTPMTALLRVMVLRSAPPIELADKISSTNARVLEEGARLRSKLPAYFAQRLALLNAHCPLLPPLVAIVHGYQEPTTTEELWATGLGAAARTDDGDST
jgi:ankyrin repeat protein